MKEPLYWPPARGASASAATETLKGRLEVIGVLAVIVTVADLPSAAIDIEQLAPEQSMGMSVMCVYCGAWIWTMIG
ncbi:hypothetical protein [Streptomyces sioyaensis]|uniref:hypothetical protein n=1 Tax=Streptomyces sioyaensis TaxID=67364 RepID=UPI00379F16A7